MMRICFFVITISVLASAKVWAQEEPAKPAPAASTAAPAKAARTNGRKATLNFEDELVEGSTQKPELFYLFQKKNFNYKRLIKLRENFLPEMRQTAEDLQRTRGNN